VQQVNDVADAFMAIFGFVRVTDENMPDMHGGIRTKEDGAKGMLTDLPEGSGATAEDFEAAETSPKDEKGVHQ
jgi:hypothetical protein